MYSKNILFVIPVIVIAVLIGVIYMDSLDRASAPGEALQDANHQHTNQSSYAPEPDAGDMQRILEIEQQLDTLQNENLAVAFYGELVQIYLNNDRLDGAADASARMAELTGDFKDWKNAADWFHQRLLDEENEEYVHYYAGKSIEMYEHALTIEPFHAEVKTDVAVEYMRIGQPAPAIRHLEEVLAENPDFLTANFNLGVIFHQMGNKDKSISYLNRSLELAEGSDYEAVVREFLQHSEIQTQ